MYWPSDECMAVMWKLCAVTVKNGYHGACSYNIPTRCHEWSVAGNGGNDYDWSEAEYFN